LGRKGIGQMGGLYRLLSFLEEQKYINSSWETNESGPAKKIYKTNNNGLEYLKVVSKEMEIIKSKISMFQKRAKQIEENF
jgi:DNA-binding PadR family transcriptional regulator